MAKKIVITIILGLYPYIFLLLSKISDNFIIRQNTVNYLISSVLLIFSYIIFSLIKSKYNQKSNIINFFYLIVFFSITYFLIWKHFIVVLIFITELIRLFIKPNISKRIEKKMNRKNQYRLIKLIFLVISWAIVIKIIEHSVSTKNLIGLMIIFISTLCVMFDLKDKYGINDKILGKRLMILFIIYNTYFLWGTYYIVFPFAIVGMLTIFEKIK